MKKGRLIVAIIIIVYAVSIIYVGSTFVKKNNQPQAPVQKTEKPKPGVQKPTGPVLAEAEPVMTPEEIDEIKMEVVRGQRVKVPEGMDTTKIIREYLHECYNVADDAQSIGCYEEYYDNNDEEFFRDKEECGTDTDCLDKVYYDMANTTQDRFCYAIENEEMMQECATSIG